MAFKYKELIMNLYSDEILQDIALCRIRGAANVMMKFELMGIRPDPHFISSLFGMLSFGTDTSENAYKILYGFAEKETYIDLFKDKDVMTNIIHYLNTDRFLDSKTIRERVKKIILKISEKRPGILIRYYINNKDMFKPSPTAYNDSMEVFEEYVIRLSAKLAEKNPEYREKYHKKVMEIYEENWNIMSVMR